MTPTSASHRITRACATASAAIVVASGCSAADPQAELERAIRATVLTPVTFEVTARADRGALDALGEGAADAAAFLDEAALRGAHDGSGTVHLEATIGGAAPLLEAIVRPRGGLYLRTGLGDLLGIVGGDPAAQLGPALAERGVSEAGRQALAVSFAGGWIEVTDVEGFGDLAGRFGVDADGAADGAADAPFTSFQGLLAAIEVTGARDAGDVRRLDVVVAVGGALAAFGIPGDVARTVPGTVALRDGLVQEVRLELVDGGTDAGGLVELVVTITPTDDGDIDEPDPGASLTAAELADLVERLQDPGP